MVTAKKHDLLFARVTAHAEVNEPLVQTGQVYSIPSKLATAEQQESEE